MSLTAWRIRSMNRPTLRGGQSLTSAGQPDVGIRVDKEPQVEHVPDVLIVENQDPLKEDNVCGIDHGCLRQPARRKHPERVGKGVK